MLAGYPHLRRVAEPWPDGLMRLAIDAAGGHLGAVLAHAAALEASTGEPLRIDGSRAMAVLELLGRDPRGLGCNDGCGYDSDCDHDPYCDEYGAYWELHYWVSLRLAPPCSLEQIATAWTLLTGSDESKIAHKSKIADRIKKYVDKADFLSVACAYEALSGDDRAEFAAAIRGAAVNVSQRAYYEPGYPRALVVSRLWSECPELSRWCRAAKTVRSDVWRRAGPGLLGIARSIVENGLRPDTDRVYFDPAWPPAEIRARARLVAASRAEHYRRRRVTLRRNMRAVVLARAAAAAGASALCSARAAAAIAYLGMPAMDTD